MSTKEINTMQYLRVIIQNASWIPEGYPELCKAIKEEEEMRELYLCACASVPAEMAVQAQKSEDPVAALRQLRDNTKKALERDLFNMKEQLAQKEEENRELRTEQERWRQMYECKPLKKWLYERKKEKEYQKRAAFVKKLLKEEYQEEQLRFLLDCIEEEKPLSMIENIASPEFPTHAMKRMMQWEENRRKKNGYKQGS